MNQSALTAAAAAATANVAGIAGIIALAGLCEAQSVGTLPTPKLQLDLLGRYETGIFAGAAAEIVAHDPLTQRLFVTNSADQVIDVIDASNPVAPKLVHKIDTTPLGGAPTSVAVFGGILAVAVPASDGVSTGKVGLYSVAGLKLKTYDVGVLPDMLTFTHDGTKLVVACEGEPAGGVETPGSVSVIDLSAGAGKGVVTTLGFDAFDARTEELRAKGVRIFPGALPSLDFEPEYVAIAPDDSLAFVGLQEASAFAVVDLVALAIVDVVPMGTKDHLRGLPTLETFEFPALPVLGTTAAVNPADPAQSTASQDILLGGFSGLWFEGSDPATGNLRFLTVPDRGPNGEPTDVDLDGANERPFALPDYQARIHCFELDPATGAIALTSEIPLWRADGTTPISGRPNAPGLDEEPVDLWGNLLGYDELGADLEGVVIAGDGTYWMCDEYRPALYHFDAAGILIDRLVPAGTAAAAGQPLGTFGSETLPADYGKRVANRGFEALALDDAAGVVYAFIQTPLANPSKAASDASDVIRVLGVDAATGAPVSEHVYLLEAPDHRAAKVDKIGDAVFAGDGRFFVLERDASTASFGKKYLFEVDLLGATNLLDPSAPALLGGKTLEQHGADDLVGLGIRPLAKRKIANLPSLGYLAGDKTEGLALLDDGRLAVLNDNDFGVQAEPIPVDGTVPLSPDPTPVVLGLLTFPGASGLDASDRDDSIAIRSWPVRGMFMPDAISAFETGGELYFATANEGDARASDVRIKDLVLDPVAFPDASIADDDQLGRLKVSENEGDLDGDGDYDYLQAYGARSFSIWDRYGNLVFDSGEEVERTLEALYPADFHSDNEENDSFDDRSDDKGAEPEALVTAKLRGKTLAFLGLERMGGILVFDVTDPRHPEFVEYRLDRDFSGDPAAGTAGDLAPEGIVFVPRNESPIGAPLLIVANEVSGSTTIYRLKTDQ